MYLHTFYPYSMNRVPLNFRLTNNSIEILDELAQENKVSKTEVIELALKSFYNSKKKMNENGLTKFSGAWKNLDVDTMLNEIKKAKKSKVISFK